MNDKLYEGAIVLSEQLKIARLEVLGRKLELRQAQYDLNVAKAKVERALIKKVGNEKKLSSTAEGRERIFVLARDADETYRARLARYNEVYERLERAKIEAQLLQDKLNVILAVLRGEGQCGG